MNLHTPRLSVLLLLLVFAICLSVAGQSTSTQTTPAFDKPAFEAYVRHLFVAGPDVALKISDPKPSDVPGMREVVVQLSAQGRSVERRFFLSSDGRRAIQGTVYDLQDNPFRTALSKLTTDSLPALGTPGAPVVLVLFTDFQCPFCRNEAGILRQNLLQTYPKEVRLYLKDFPLEQLHPWAKLAAMAGRCIFRRSPAAFWAYHDWVFEQQDQITVENLRSKVMDFARGKEIDTLQLGRCLETKETEAEVNKSIADALALELVATPTLFVNGRHIPEEQMPWQQLRQVIDNEIAYQKTAKNAGDQGCCEVKLPSPLSK